VVSHVRVVVASSNGKAPSNLILVTNCISVRIGLTGSVALDVILGRISAQRVVDLRSRHLRVVKVARPWRLADIHLVLVANIIVVLVIKASTSAVSDAIVVLTQAVFSGLSIVVASMVISAADNFIFVTDCIKVFIVQTEAIAINFLVRVFAHALDMSHGIHAFVAGIFVLASVLKLVAHAIIVYVCFAAAITVAEVVRWPDAGTIYLMSD